MRTNMEYLADVLKEDILLFHLGNDEEANFLYAAEYMEKSAQGCCAIMDAAAFQPEMADRSVFNWIIRIKDAPSFSEERRKALRSRNYLLVSDSLSFETIVEKAAAVVKCRENFYAQIEHLTKATYSGRGLQAVVDTGAQLLDAPVAIMDTAFMSLAHAGAMNLQNEYYTKSFREGYIAEDTVKLLKKTRRIIQIQSQEGVFFTPNTFPEIHTTSYGWLDVSVRINRMAVAYISVAGETHPFSEFDKDVLDYLAQVAALEIQKNEFFIQNHGIMYETFMYDLLDQRMKTPESVKSRMRVLNIKLEKYCYIIAIHRKKENRSGIIPSGTQTLFRNLFRGSISVPYKKGIVLLLSSADWNMDLPRENDELTALLKSHDLYMGISNSFQDLRLAGKYYLQAYRAIEYGRRIDGSSYWYYYRDYNMYQAIDLYSKEEDLLELCHPAVRMLYKSVKTADQELLETLDSYIRNMKNVAQITEELHIHKSTLFYRIGKIKALTKSELNDGDIWMQLSHSMKILRFLNALKSTD